MRLTYRDIASTYNMLDSIMDKKLPLSISHIINRNYKKLRECNSDFEKERVELAKKYSKRDEDGNIKMKVMGNEQRFEIENYQAFNDEFEELANIEIDVPLDTFSEKTLSIIDGNERYDQLTPRDISALEIMIKEDDE